MKAKVVRKCYMPVLWNQLGDDFAFSASRSATAQASQQTSTVFLPTLTFIGLSPMSSSQAAQVLAVILVSPSSVAEQRFQSLCACALSGNLGINSNASCA
jgi:hypothetical protein